MRNLKKHVWKAIPIVMVLVMLMSMTVFAAEEAAEVPKMYATFWALVPPLVAIALALITKEVFSSVLFSESASIEALEDTADSVSGLKSAERAGAVESSLKSAERAGASVSE